MRTYVRRVLDDLTPEAPKADPKSTAASARGVAPKKNASASTGRAKKVAGPASDKLAGKDGKGDSLLRVRVKTDKLASEDGSLD